MYLERMIGARLEGEAFRQFKAIGGWKDLQDSVRSPAGQPASQPAGAPGTPSSRLFVPRRR